MTNLQAIDLLKGLEQSLDDYCELNDEGKTAFGMAITALELFGNSEQLPPAEPKRGRWMHHPEIGWGETWLCDQCGEKTTSTVMGKPRANFCPNCGADMREVNHESNRCGCN